MYAREGNPRACAYCGAKTLFVLAEITKRGKVKLIDVCVPCGELPARREELSKKPEPTAASAKTKRPARDEGTVAA